MLASPYEIIFLFSQEIEADKRVAAKNNPNKDVNSYTRETSSPGSSSPQKESKVGQHTKGTASRLLVLFYYKLEVNVDMMTAISQLPESVSNKTRNWRMRGT